MEEEDRYNKSAWGKLKRFTDSVRLGLRGKNLTLFNLFRLADTKRSGVIDIKTLRNCLERLLPDFPKRDLFKSLRMIDINNDGLIDSNEFRLIFNVKSM